MARIRLHHRVPTATFRELQMKTLEHGDHGDCTVKALAIVTGVSYEEARRAMEQSGRKNKRGANMYIVQAAAKLLGFELYELPDKWVRDLIASYPGAHKGLQHLTTHHPVRFKKQWRDLPPLYLDLKIYHVAAFRDGQLHDWTVGKALRVDKVYGVRPLAGADDQSPLLITTRVITTREEPPAHLSYQDRIKHNDAYELADLRQFLKSEAWNRLPKADREQIMRRIRFLEGLVEGDKS